MVFRFFDAFCVLEGVLRGRLERRPRDLSQQGHVVAVKFVADIVEQSKPRKDKKFVRNFVGDALLGAGRGLFLGWTHSGGRKHSESDQ